MYKQHIHIRVILFLTYFTRMTISLTLPMSLQMALFASFLFWLVVFLLHICHIFVHSSVDVRSDCFHVLVVVNSAVQCTLACMHLFDSWQWTVSDLWALKNNWLPRTRDWAWPDRGSWVAEVFYYSERGQKASDTSRRGQRVPPYFSVSKGALLLFN